MMLLLQQKQAKTSKSKLKRRPFSRHTRRKLDKGDDDESYGIPPFSTEDKPVLGHCDDELAKLLRTPGYAGVWPFRPGGGLQVSLRLGRWARRRVNKTHNLEDDIALARQRVILFFPFLGASLVVSSNRRQSGMADVLPPRAGGPLRSHFGAVSEG